MNMLGNLLERDIEVLSQRPKLISLENIYGLMTTLQYV